MSEYTPSYPSFEEGLAETAYHGLDLMSASRLKKLDGSTSLHLHDYIHGEQPDTAAFVVGRALHCKVLRPLDFDMEFAVSPKFDGRTTEGKNGKALFAIQNEGKSVLTLEDAKDVMAMEAGICSNPDAYDLLRKCKGTPELSLFAEINGIKSRARLDRFIEIGGATSIVDVKTTRNLASKRDCERAIWTYGYGLQAAFYLRMAHAVGFPCNDFIFVMVEKNPPFASAVYRLTDEVVRLFDDKLDTVIQNYNDYITQGPRGFEGIQDIGVPAWAFKELTLIGDEND